MTILDRLEDMKDIIRIRIIDKKRAYQGTFPKDGLASSAVLADFAQFCHATTSTFSADPYVHALREGRREVWLRIQKYLNLSFSAGNILDIGYYRFLVQAIIG